MVYLARHRAEAPHLPHQPLQHRHLKAPVGRPEFSGLLPEVDQDCARFEDADRLASRALGINYRGDAVVWADFQESRVELLAFGDVHGLYGVGQTHLFQSDTDLAAVRGVPGVEFDAHRDPPIQSSIYSTRRSLPNRRLRIHRDRLLPQSELRRSEVFSYQRNANVAQRISAGDRCHGRTQSKNAMFSWASKNLGTRSYRAQCCFATRVAPSMSPA